MKLLNLTKAMAVVAATTMSVTSFAASVEGTGNALTNAGDSVFSALTGKTGYAAVNHPVSLYDYTEATSAYEDAYINANFNANSNSNDDKDGKKQQSSYDLDVELDYEKVYSSPDANVKYDANVSGSVNRSATDGADSEDDYTIQASANYDKYFDPANSKLFWYGKGELEIKKEGLTTEKDGVKTYDDEYAGFDDPRITATGGIGYGRVVNVTPMARSIRLVESLVERGILKNVPSRATYNKIAMIASKESEYRSKYGAADYGQYWVRDVERALGQSIGANGAIKAYEVLTQERISTRKYGWDVRAGVGAVLSDFDGENGKPVLEAEGNYYYPISNKTQFSNEARFKTILDDDNNSYNFGNDMKLTYEVSDRVDWENGWKFDYTSVDGAEDVMRNELSSSYNYYISNAISFGTTLKFTHLDDGIDDNGNDNVDTSLNMGIKYRLK